jgi:hypothetical protein
MKYIRAIEFIENYKIIGRERSRKDGGREAASHRNYPKPRPNGRARDDALGKCRARTALLDKFDS